MIPIDTPVDSAIAPRVAAVKDTGALTHDEAAKRASLASRFAMAPAAITHSSRGATISREDSILSERFTPHVGWDWMRPPTAAELAALRSDQRSAERVALRATSGGNARDVHTMTGEGSGAVGAVGGGKTGVSASEGQPMLSIPLPLFSSGPSAAQRRRDAQVNADNQARLHRLEARLRAMRDSIHADSLHRDSLARQIRP